MVKLAGGIHGDRRLALLYKARWRARRKGIPFSLSIDDIEVPERCPILGTPWAFNARRGASPHPCAMSLDRIDPGPEVGYVPGNVWVISYAANVAKAGMGPEAIEALVVGLVDRGFIDRDRVIARLLVEEKIVPTGTPPQADSETPGKEIGLGNTVRPEKTDLQFRVFGTILSGSGA